MLKRFLRSSGSGRVSTMLSDCDSATKPSSSRCVGPIMILWKAPALDQRLGPHSHAGNVAGDDRMTGRDRRTLEPSDDHSSSGSQSVCEFTGETCRWGSVGPDSAPDHVHCMRHPRATTVARLRGSKEGETRCQGGIEMFMSTTTRKAPIPGQLEGCQLRGDVARTLASSGSAKLPTVIYGRKFDRSSV